MLIVDKILILLTGLISRESWSGGLLVLGEGSELGLKVSFPLPLRAEQCENRLPSALPGIQGEGEIQGSSMEGACRSPGLWVSWSHRAPV